MAKGKIILVITAIPALCGSLECRDQHSLIEGRYYRPRGVQAGEKDDVWLQKKMMKMKTR